MLDLIAIEALGQSMKRIFALKVNRSTWREIQNISFNLSQGNQDLASDLLNAFFTDEVGEGLAEDSARESLQKLVEEYGLFVRLSREISEKGDFVSIISSDILANHDRLALLNRIRRVDGEEFHFITDAESTLHVLQHFLNRFSELPKQERGKQILELQKGRLQALQKQISALITEVS